MDLNELREFMCKRLEEKGVKHSVAFDLSIEFARQAILYADRFCEKVNKSMRVE
jgi:hypothetical protein